MAARFCRLGGSTRLDGRPPPVGLRRRAGPVAPRWTNDETPTLSFCASFGSFFAVKLVGELRGHEARLGRSSFAAYVLAEHWRVLAANGPHMTGLMESWCAKRV